MRAQKKDTFCVKKCPYLQVGGSAKSTDFVLFFSSYNESSHLFHFLIILYMQYLHYLSTSVLAISLSKSL